MRGGHQSGGHRGGDNHGLYDDSVGRIGNAQRFFLPSRTLARPSSPPPLRPAPEPTNQQVDVLDGVEQANAFLHRALERLAAGDQAHAAGALVDDRGLHGFLQIALAGRRAAGVDQAGAAHVAVRHLVAREVDRMVRRQLGVDLLVRLAEIRERVEPAVVLRQLLLDDVGLDGHAQVVGLAGEVGRTRDSPRPWS